MRKATGGTRQRRSGGNVRRMYFVDADVDEALRRLAFEERASLSWTVNRLLREALVSRGLLPTADGEGGAHGRET
jgi:hypothetical protein